MKICKRGHSRESGECKECRKINIKAWKTANSDKEKANTKKYYEANKDKRFKEHAQWRKSNPEKAFKIVRKSIVKKFNITLSQYDDMLKSQDNKCKICSIDQKALSKSLAIDHDHKTGKIRGLLCSTCNQALGLLKDNIQNLLKAAEYLGENSSDVE